MTDNEEKTDVFVHQSNIQADGFRSLNTDQKIEFEIAKDDNGRLLAKNVSSFLLEESWNCKHSPGELLTRPSTCHIFHHHPRTWCRLVENPMYVRREYISLTNAAAPRPRICL